MGTEAEAKEYKGHNIVIEYDENPENPRDWDNLTEIHYLNTSRYILGDKEHTHPDSDSMDEMVKEALKQGDIVVPLYAYIHGGVALSTGPFYDKDLPQGHAQFDSGQCGFVVVRREVMLKEWKAKIFHKKLKEMAMSHVEGDIETFNAYLSGQVFGYIIDDDDSCWGYYSIKDAMDEAEGIVDWMVEDAKEQHCE